MSAQGCAAHEPATYVLPDLGRGNLSGVGIQSAGLVKGPACIAYSIGSHGSHVA